MKKNELFGFYKKIFLTNLIEDYFCDFEGSFAIYHLKNITFFENYQINIDMSYLNKESHSSVKLYVKKEQTKLYANWTMYWSFKDQSAYCKNFNWNYIGDLKSLKDNLILIRMSLT